MIGFFSVILISVIFTSYFFHFPFTIVTLNPYPGSIYEQISLGNQLSLESNMIRESYQCLVPGDSRYGQGEGSRSIMIMTKTEKPVDILKELDIKYRANLVFAYEDSNDRPYYGTDFPFSNVTITEIFPNPNYTSGKWYDLRLPRRKPFTITLYSWSCSNNLGINCDMYLLNVTKENEMSSDYHDLRFVDNNGYLIPITQRYYDNNKVSLILNVSRYINLYYISGNKPLLGGSQPVVITGFLYYGNSSVESNWASPSMTWYYDPYANYSVNQSFDMNINTYSSTETRVFNDSSAFYGHSLFIYSKGSNYALLKKYMTIPENAIFTFYWKRTTGRIEVAFVDDNDTVHHPASLSVYRSDGYTYYIVDGKQYTFYNSGGTNIGEDDSLYRKYVIVKKGNVYNISIYGGANCEWTSSSNKCNVIVTTSASHIGFPRITVGWGKDGETRLDNFTVTDLDGNILWKEDFERDYHITFGDAIFGDVEYPFLRGNTYVVGQIGNNKDGYEGYLKQGVTYEDIMHNFSNLTLSFGNASNLSQFIIEIIPNNIYVQTNYYRCCDKDCNFQCMSYCTEYHCFQTESVCSSCHINNYNDFGEYGRRNLNLHRSSTISSVYLEMYYYPPCEKGYRDYSTGECLINCVSTADCPPSPCVGVVSYCGTDNRCHLEGSCVETPQNDWVKSLMSWFDSIINAIKSWLNW